MRELKVHYNRYDAAPLAEQLDPKLLRFNANEAWIELSLGDNDEFAIYFDSTNDEVDPELLIAARSLMRAIGKLDNQVQDSCAAECRKTSQHPDNYESRLAYVRIFQDRALLCYYGAKVNTDWDEAAKLLDGECGSMLERSSELCRANFKLIRTIKIPGFERGGRATTRLPALLAAHPAAE